MQQEILTIARRFNGPPGSGNGGYVSGLLSRHISGACETSLRAPPPLEAPLSLVRGESVELRDGDTVIAEARAVASPAAARPAPSLADAAKAAEGFVGRTQHAYNTCFVCGCGRPDRDGLDLFTGPLLNGPAGSMVATPWIPAADLAGADGALAPEFVHAGLDCPTYWALPRAGELRALLARFTVAIDAPAPMGETLIVAAWPLASEGRKHSAASALYTADGAVLARAEALWIEPRPSPAGPTPRRIWP